jgi:hypothetical protein
MTVSNEKVVPMLHWIESEDRIGFPTWLRMVECSQWGLFCTHELPRWINRNDGERKGKTDMPSPLNVTKQIEPDILDRLRSGLCAVQCKSRDAQHDCDCSIAAAEIEALRREKETLWCALGKLLDELPPDFPNRNYYNEITASAQPRVSARKVRLNLTDEWCLAAADREGRMGT